MNYNADTFTIHDANHDNEQNDRNKRLIEFCGVARSRDEMQTFLGITNRGHFRTAMLKPLLESGELKMALPDKPSSHNQRYIKAK